MQATLSHCGGAKTSHSRKTQDSASNSLDESDESRLWKNRRSTDYPQARVKLVVAASRGLVRPVPSLLRPALLPVRKLCGGLVCGGQNHIDWRLMIRTEDKPSCIGNLLHKAPLFPDHTVRCQCKERPLNVHPLPIGMAAKMARRNTKRAQNDHGPINQTVPPGSVTSRTPVVLASWRE